MQRLDKVPQDAGIKLSSVASNVLCVSGQAMLEALVRGTHDPELLAELARGRLRQKLPALRQALTGRFRAHDALIVSQILAHVDFLDETIAVLSAEIDQVIALSRTSWRCLTRSPASISAPRRRCWPRSGPTCPSS